MEKNTKDKKKEKSRSSNKRDKTEVENIPFGQSIFDYDELTMAVLSHLSIVELFNVRSICKKWNALVLEPTIWKGVILSTFGVFVGSEYRKIIKNTSGADLLKAVKDPAFARSLFGMDNDLTEDERIQDIVGIPLRLSTKQALIGRLFSDKPIWRSPWLMNTRSNTNDRLFMLPQFQPHDFPQADSVFTQLFFAVIHRRTISPTELWTFIEDRAKTADRPKAVAIICHWMANYNWQEHSELLDPLLGQFLATATTEEKQQIARARYLSTLSKEFDWQRHDQTFKEKLSDEQKEAFKANIKSKLLQGPIDIMNIPPREMAKQIALVEQKHFRKLTIDFFMAVHWRNSTPIQRFNKLANGLTYWILSQPTSDKRYEAVGYLIKLGYECISIRCASALLLVISCLSNASLTRLFSVRKAQKKYAKEMEEIDRIGSMRMGYKALRNFHKESIDLGQASVPYLGMTLTDLTFIEDGHAMLQNNLINVQKSVLTMSVICNIMQVQLVPYLYEPVESLQLLWEAFADNNFDPDEFYKYSLAIMARGAEKENDSLNNSDKK